MKSYISILITLSILFSSPLLGQNFTSKIKDNATVVFSLNGKNLLKKVPENKINVSQFFYQLKKEFGLSNLKNLEDLGLNFNSEMYYALELDTNFMMSLFFVPIKDKAKFEAITSKTFEGKKIINYKGYNSFSDFNKTEHVVWNNDFVVFAFGYYTGKKHSYSYGDFRVDYDYYQEGRTAEKVLKEEGSKDLSIQELSDRMDELQKSSYKLSQYYEKGYPNQPLSLLEDEEVDNQDKEAAETAAQDAGGLEIEGTLVEASQVNDEAEEVIEVVDDPEEEEEEEEIHYMETTSVEVEEMIDAVADGAEEASDDSYYYNRYDRETELTSYRKNIRNSIKNRRQALNDKKKKEVVSLIFKNRFNAIFNTTISNSISQEKSFKNSRDQKADGILWMESDYLQNGIKSTFNTLLGYSIGGMRGYNRFSNPFYQFGKETSVSKLYFEKKGIRLTQTMDNGKETKKIMNDVFSTTQDSRFFDYVNGDNFVGYVSSSFNSEAVIREMPNVYAQTLSRYFPERTEEANVLAAILEVFIDEKSIGELATGNGLFVFKNMTEKEVSYTAYEYDEDYVRTAVEKIKKEYLPNFLLMYTTENQDLLERILKLGLKNEVLSKEEDYYSIDKTNTGFPLDLFFTIKDGIVFITTDEVEIQTITRGGKMKGLAKKHQKLASANSQVVYFDSKKIIDLIPEEDFNRSDLESFNYFKQNSFEEVLITTRNNNGNIISEGYMKTPDFENSADYLFELINQLIDINNR